MHGGDALPSPLWSPRSYPDRPSSLVSSFSFLPASRSNPFRLVRSLFILFHGAKKEYKALPWSVGEAVGRAWSAAVYAEPPCLPPAAAGLRVRPCSLGGYVSSVRLGAHRTTMDAELRRVKRRDRGRKGEAGRRQKVPGARETRPHRRTRG